MPDDRDGAHDDTLTASPEVTPGPRRGSAVGGASPRAEAEATLPQIALGSGVASDPALTRPSDPVLGEHGAPGSRPEGVIRAGRPADYSTLMPVDPAHYVRTGELARGGMGKITAAHDRRLGRDVALKELLAPSDALRARFEREARITARLQHPVTIGVLEAGVWPTGDPFYAMNLVSGRSLDKVIAAQPALEQRFALVANVIAVADTIAYAHSRRIIHRDLKPANVLIGEFGETVVIDWGLAKDLADSSSLPDVSVGPYRGTGTDTEVGTVIGTPAYMPPEQANGDPVDERADVYALGALLYHVLAGAPPYVGPTSDAVLAEVIAGPPRPILEVAPTVPPDLATIVHTAMARAPRDRYPSAKELAAALKQFQTGQLVRGHHYTAGQLFQRWLRRHRTAVAVGVAALIVLAVVGAFSVRRIVDERERAEAQRAVAETQRRLAITRGADAQELMSFMLGDLREKLAPVGKLDLLAAVARKAVAYYEQRPDDETDADRGRRATALQNIGDVLLAQGDVARALALFQQAQGIAEGLRAADPTRSAWQLILATTDNRIGAVHMAHGELEATRGDYQHALDGLQAVVAKEPDHAEALRALVNTHRQLGDTLVDLGDGTAAVAQFRAAIALASKQAARAPGDLTWRRALAVNHSQLGGVLLLQGDVDGALREHREDVALSSQIVAADPTSGEAQNDLAGARSRVGDALTAKGDNAGALVEYRAALDVMKHLTERDPTNADWQQDRAVSHDRVGNLLLALGDPRAALVEYREGMAIKHRLADKDPTNRVAQRILAIGFNKLGSVMEQEHQPAAALAEYRKGLEILDGLTRAEPTNAGWQRDLAVSHYLVADMLLATKDPGHALDEARRSLALVEALATQDPANALWQADVIESHEQVGKMLRALGRRDEALASYQAGLARAEQQAKADPSNPAWTAAATRLRATIATRH